MSWSVFGSARRAVEGAPSSLARFVDALGERAEEELGLAPGEVAVCWELARRCEVDDPEREALLAVLVALRVALCQGSTCVRRTDGSDPREASLPALLSALAPEDAPGGAELLARADALLSSELPAPFLGGPGERRVLVRDGERLYLHATWELERRLAAQLASRLLAVPTPAFPAKDQAAALDEVCAAAPFPLSGEQRAAVAAAATSGLTLISGGPGTGKTSIVATLLRLLARLGIPPEQVALAAPTGKAGQRLAEAIQAHLAQIKAPTAADQAVGQGPAPKTLHRLLGYSGGTGRFRFHQGRPLDARVVIVDEASMISLDLMQQLLLATPPGARLVLLGDSDQLTSVGAGAVLRDLTEAAAAGAEPLRERVRVLQQSYRMDPQDPQGRAIYQAAHRVLAGDAAGLLGEGEGALVRRSDAAELTFTGAEALLHEGASGDPLGAFLDRWFEERIVQGERKLLEHRLRRLYRVADGGFVGKEDATHLRHLFDTYERSRLLSPVRAGRQGTRALNAALQAKLGQLTGSGGAGFAPGEPALVQQNDYELGLWNGDLGVVVLAAAPGEHARRRVVAFPRSQAPGGYVAYPLALLQHRLEPAFALTVHKAQGSEADVVALALPTRDTPLLTREIVYTALTRARTGALVLGAPELLARAVATPTRRTGGLVGQLQAALGGVAAEP